MEKIVITLMVYEMWLHFIYSFFISFQFDFMLKINVTFFLQYTMTVLLNDWLVTIGKILIVKINC